MAIENFKPTIWSARLLNALDKVLVFGDVVNRDYEGEISGYGDTVKINELGEITVSNYSGTVSYQELDDAQKILEIDQAKYFAFAVDDVDSAQSNIKVMDKAMARAGYSVRDTVDQFIAAFHSSAGVTGSLGTTSVPISINSSNIVEYIGLVAKGLDEANVPSEGRWLVAPPWFHHKLVLAGIAKATDNDQIIQNGRIAKFGGFDIRMSNNVVTDSSTYSKIMAGTNEAISYAGQIAKVEALRRESSFSDAVKGLYVYGAKVVQPDALACLTAYTTAEA